MILNEFSDIINFLFGKFFQIKKVHGKKIIVAIIRVCMDIIEKSGWITLMQKKIELLDDFK
jgi:hypothetical protein